MIRAGESASVRRLDRPDTGDDGNRVRSILLVEDEALVRDMVRAFLKRAGYHVTVAGSAEEALDLMPVAAGLLLTDIELPGRDGIELATRLRCARPELMVIYMSGNVSDPTARELGEYPGTRFLAKPFSRATLLEAISALTGDDRR